MRRWLLIMAVVLAGTLLGACGSDNGNQPATSTPDVPSVTPIQRTPFPPTWTPSPAGFVPSRTPTPEKVQSRPDETGPGGALVGGTPFPPTWTPGPPPTKTPLYSPTPTWTPFPTLPPAPTRTLQPDYCYELQAVSGSMETRAGVPVIVRWNPIPRYSSYLVIVRHPGGGVIYTEPAEGGQHELSGDLFRTAGAYGWEIWPLDDAGNRACFPISGEIIVRF